jgi:hypothetical protein
MCYFFADLEEEEYPTWEEISDAIEKLDGVSFNNFVFEINGVAMMTCGGGNLIEGERRYVVSYVSADKNCSLINPEEPKDKEYTITIQTPDIQLARWCVKIEDVVAAFKYFYENKGNLNPHLHWDCV